MTRKVFHMDAQEHPYAELKSALQAAHEDDDIWSALKLGDTKREQAVILDMGGSKVILTANRYVGIFDQCAVFVEDKHGKPISPEHVLGGAEKQIDRNEDGEIHLSLQGAKSLIQMLAKARMNSPNIESTGRVRS